MPTTLTSINNAVANFAKISLSDVAYSTLVSNAISRAYYDIARDERRTFPEIVKNRVVINPFGMITGTAVALPVDFLIEGEVRYATATREWALAPYTGRIPPAPIYGKPQSYKIVSGLTGDPTGATPTAILVFPFDGVANGENIYVDYASTPPNNTLIIGNQMAQEIQDRALAYVLTYQGKPQKANEVLKVIRNPPVNSTLQQQDAQ